MGFRKKHSTPHWLVSMIENWENTIQKGGFAAGVFIDFSKTFEDFEKTHLTL